MKPTPISDIPYAMIDNGDRLPILDITHPLFISSIDESAYLLALIKSQKSLRAIKRMPGFIRNLFVKTSNVDNTYLSGLRTLIYKLGPNLVKGIKLSFRDSWAVKQDTFMGLRIRLREICRFQAEALMVSLKSSPGKNLYFMNIAGGSASDSINTLILILKEDPELLKGRKIVIDILDIDAFGPSFAERCIETLKTQGNCFDGLDITINKIPYDWQNAEGLIGPAMQRKGWIQVCSSEGGLFEYGSDEDINQNLDCLYTHTEPDTMISGSLIFDKTAVDPGYLGFAELTNIPIRFLGLSGLKEILSHTNWVLESAREIGSVFIVFTLKKKLIS